MKIAPKIQEIGESIEAVCAWVGLAGTGDRVPKMSRPPGVGSLRSSGVVYAVDHRTVVGSSALLALALPSRIAAEAHRSKVRQGMVPARSQRQDVIGRDIAPIFEGPPANRARLPGFPGPCPQQFASRPVLRITVCRVRCTRSHAATIGGSPALVADSLSAYPVALAAGDLDHYAM
jgi:hypothetical protein